MYPPRRGGLPARGYVGRVALALSRAGNSCPPPEFPLPLRALADACTTKPADYTHGKETVFHFQSPFLLFRLQKPPLSLSMSPQTRNRKSEPGGDGIHQHISGSKSYAKVKYDMMMELGEEPSITDLVRKTHMKVDGTFSDKRAKMIVDEVESIVVSQQVNNPDHDEVTLITPLMRDEAFYLIVKPNKGKLSGLGSSQMESYDPTDPSSVVLPRQARYERDLISLTGIVKLMS